MLAVYIEDALRNVHPTTLTNIILYILIITLSFSIVLKRIGKSPGITSYTPTLLTTIGILGTFIGIVSGLLGFDTADIDGSIGPLLGGLKTAFITSLAGMSLSIFYRVLTLSTFLNDNKTEKTPEDIDIKDIYEVMTAQVKGIESLKEAITDKDDSSLIGQMRLFRSDISDMNKERTKALNSFEERLWDELNSFAEMLSKSATEQVIEALNKVIQDFNNNLKEQFGENFKELNNAVKALVTWQENYKNQLNEMTNLYDKGVQSISETESAIIAISTESKNIPKIMNQLKDVLEVNQHQITELNRHLDAFKGIRDKAVEAVPEIRAQVEQAIAGAKEANTMLANGIIESTDKVKTVMSESAENYRDTVDRTRAALVESAQATTNASEEIKQQFSDAITDINAKMRVLVTELIDGGNSLKESYSGATEKLVSETENLCQSLINEFDHLQRKISNTIESSATEHHKKAEQILGGLERKIEESLSQTGEATQKQMAMIDKALGDELEKVMNSMGSALASISGQFSNDYSKLVNQMSRIVNQQVN
jgi:ABC-type transporter Mla subunit MlaD